MSAKEQKKESPIVKIYLIILFFLGMGIWLAVQSAPKQKISIDVELDQKIVDVLLANGITQGDIISQYARERQTRAAEWNEFYKKIQLKGVKKAENFETGFRSVARSLKIGLSKTAEASGEVTYKFYAPNRSYSNITFVPSKAKTQAKAKNKERK